MDRANRLAGIYEASGLKTPGEHGLYHLEPKNGRKSLAVYGGVAEAAQ
jgi:hypothetical protein